MALFNITGSYIYFTVLHFLCFVLALAVCGLYGQDLHNGTKHHAGSDPKWVYAVVVGALSAVTCVIYFVPVVMRVASLPVSIWNLILFILWITLFGVFGKLFIHENPEGDGGIKRMKNAVWVDLVSALLWLLVTISSLGYWWKHRDNRSLFTGRAHV